MAGSQAASGAGVIIVYNSNESLKVAEILYISPLLRLEEASDYESVMDLTTHCKKEGVNLGDLMSALRINILSETFSLMQH